MKFFFTSVVLLWSILLTPNLTAQRSTTLVDLLTKLKLVEHDTAKMDIHIQLADFYISEEPNADRAMNHANLAFILAENYDDDRRKFLAIDKLIRLHYKVKYDLKMVMEYLTKAKAIDTTQISIADKALLHENEGKLFLALNEFEKSQHALFKQLNIYESLNYEMGIAKVNYDLGTLFFDQNNFQQGLVYYENALQRYMMLNDIKGKIKTLNAIGQAYGKLGDFEKNLTYSSDALILARALNDKLQLANINANIGFANAHLGKMIAALNNFNTALQIGEELQHKPLIMEAAKELGNIYHGLCDEIEALDYYQQALSAALETNSRVLEKEMLEALFKFHDDYGRDSIAYQYLKKLTVIKEELYNEERTRQLINNQIRYETEKKEEEVKQLRAQELSNTVTIQKQRFQNYALIVIILLVLTVTAFLYSAFRRKKAYNHHLQQEVKKRTSELEQSNAELKNSNSSLEQSNNELERFAYIASHDLKSPLRNVISFLNLIERRLKNYDNKDVKEYLRFATDNARQMYNLIQDVLEFSRLDHQEVSMTQVDLNESLMLVIQNLKEEMQIKNALVFAQELPIIDANSVHILQLFQNLIGNGIKYNQSSRPKVVIGHKADSTNHVFSVIDNGIGISPEYHDKIFQMFKRLHTKEEYAGTGIGLALCKKIINNLNGEIWLESKPNKGTTFYFSVPKMNIQANVAHLS